MDGCSQTLEALHAGGSLQITEYTHQRLAESGWPITRETRREFLVSAMNGNNWPVICF